MNHPLPVDGCCWIPLTKGRWALVDKESEALVSDRNWVVTSHGYATANRVYMHRLIVGASTGVIVDHKNHNKLDNRRENLRLTTQVGNTQNKQISKNNQSGYKGVHWHKKNEVWRAQIKVGSKIVSLGCFDDLQTAARAYDAAAIEHFGEFAFLNFPKGDG